MAKQTINIGSSANDGQGDPLRTAMDKINDNFDEIYTAGPVSSNIKIANSTITTTNTNGNLLLRGNGTGKIDVGAVGNLRITGGANGYVLTTDGTGNVAFNDVGNITFANLLATSGNITQDLVVGGNLTVNGTTTTINTATLDVEDKLITIAFGAANSAVADGAGINIAGANANITYANATNSFNLNKNVIVSGNILPSANVTYSLGNVTNQWKDLYVSNNTIYINNVPLSVTTGNVLTIGGQPLLSNGSGTTISTTGNITGGYILGNGSQLTGITSYSNSNVTTLLAAYGNNTISTTGNIAGGNILTAGLVSATGNITGNYILGNGSQLTGLPATYGNANVVANLAALGSNPISTTGNVTGGNILTGGLISATGNVSGGNLNVTGNIIDTGALSLVTGSSGNVSLAPNGTNVVIATTTGANITGTLNATGNVTGGNILTAGLISATGNVTAANFIGNISITGNVTGTSANVTLVAGAYSTVFDNTGNVTLANSNVFVGVTNTILTNTVGSFSANANSYTQVTLQNKNTGTDATVDLVVTSDNGSDAVNYGDFGIINSGYDNGTPTNSLGNIVFGADTYIYAQGNVGNTGQSGGNLVIGTTVATKTIKLFAGGNTSSALVATVSNTGITMNSGNITGNTAGFAIGYRDIPQVAFTANATIATTDAGKHYYSTQSTSYILTIANNASQGFQVGSAITVVNQGTGNITVAQGSGVTLYLAGNATSGNRTVTTFGMATIMKVATNTWFINGTGVS